MTSAGIRKLARRLMLEYQPLPAAELGGFQISNSVEPPGRRLAVVSPREAIFTGLPVTVLSLRSPYTVQYLKHDHDGVWMSTLPCELVQAWNEFAGRSHGRILIGGLGLGVVVDMCLRRPDVEHVTVIEKFRAVIELNQSRSDPRLTVVQGDLYKILRQRCSGREYDMAFFDIWQCNGEYVWQTEVVPLRRLFYKQAHPSISLDCWQERVMQGQVWRNLFRAADINEEKLKRLPHCHLYAFRRAVVELGIRDGRNRLSAATPLPVVLEIEEENRNDPRLQQLATDFLTTVGTPSWERRFGSYWDLATEFK